jgi:predicted dehydrogenase
VLQTPGGTTVVRDVPVPPTGHGSVLVANHFSVISSGTERSRIELAKKSLVGKARERPDLVREVVQRARREGLASTQRAVRQRLAEETPVGYSSAGVVVEVGAGVRGLEPGDAVACAGGGHANHAAIVSIPRNLCAKVPAGVPLEAAAFSTIGAIALHGVRLARVALGERVAVIGCGLVGQLTCRLLRTAGAVVSALDIDEERVRTATGAGADHGMIADEQAAARIMELTGGMGVDQVIVTAASSSAEPLRLASAIARDRGTIVLVGAVPIEFARAALYDKELVFRVSRSYGPGRYDPEYEERGLDYPIGFVRWTQQRNMECVLELQARGRLAVIDLIDEIVPVEEAERAYARLVGDRQEVPRGGIVLSFEAAHTVSAPEAADPAMRESLAPVVHEQAKPKRGIGSGRAVRIGLIGPGGFAARVIVPALMAADVRLELVGGGSGPSAEAARRNLGFARVAASEDAVIEDEDIDAVVICTRHGSHSRLAARALERGKHVFCEKPLALTRQELEAVLAAARSAPGVLAVGFNRRFAPMLGEVKHAVNGSLRLLGLYRVSAGRVPAGHWVHDLEQGGGRALGEVCHFIDSLAFVVGARVVDVHARGYGDQALPLQAFDNLAIDLGFADGSLAAIVYAADGSPAVPKERVEIFTNGTTAILDDYRTFTVFRGRERKQRRVRTQDKGHLQELAAFVQAVQKGEPPVDLGDLENVSLATLAVVDSMRTGEPVRLST